MSGAEGEETAERPPSSRHSIEQSSTEPLAPFALPRDAFRHQRATATTAAPVIVTPDYDDQVSDTAAVPAETTSPGQDPIGLAPPARRQPKAKAAAPRNPFNAYGERTSSRPYALRLPDAIDLALRQMAAEERTHPLRVIDRILHEHLKRIGRLPPPGGT